MSTRLHTIRARQLVPTIMVLAVLIVSGLLLASQPAGATAHIGGDRFTLLHAPYGATPTFTPTFTPTRTFGHPTPTPSFTPTGTPPTDTPTRTSGHPTPTPTFTPVTSPTVTPTPGPCAGAWSVVPSPNRGSNLNELYDVSAAAAISVWAAGTYYTNGNPDQTLIEHWDGSSWSIISSPNQGTRDNYLEGVAAAGLNDVWAVGSYINSASFGQTLIERWNGGSWSIIPSPNQGPLSNFLSKVAVAGPNDVWAVGRYIATGIGVPQTLVEHWDGSAWTIVPSPNQGTSYDELYDVAVAGPNDVWAVGYYYNGSVKRTLVEHWDGIQWSIVLSPNQGTGPNQLNGVAAAGAGGVWAVGFYAPNSSSGMSQTLVEHWDGSAWGIKPSPNQGAWANSLHGVAAAGPNDLWAAGSYINDPCCIISRTLMEHWDGSAWTIVPSPNQGTGENIVWAVTAAGPDNVWAAGYWGSAGVQAPQTLVEGYSICPASPTSTPTYTRTRTPTSTSGHPTATYTFTRTRTPTYTPSASATPTITGTPDTPTPVPTCGPPTGYEISQSSGAAIVPGDTLVPGSQANDASVNIALPFYYYLYGFPTNGIRAGTDGMLVFYTGSNTGANSCLPMWNWQQVIFPHWDDLDMSPSIGTGLGIYTSVTGVAPNRVFNIEWRACLHAGQTCGGEVNFEVRLFERQERFDLVYGNVAGYGGGATVGVQSYRDQSFTQLACNTQSLFAGLQLTFQEPACTNPYPTIGPTYTPTVTGTPTPPTPCAIAFTDVQPSDYFYDAVFYLYCHQAISGYADGTFRPYNNTTRGQLAKIVVLAQGWPLYTPPTPTFVDVPPSDPFFAYVETAYSRGIISGYTCGGAPTEPCLEYRPGNNVTRGQLTKIVVLAQGWPLYTPPAPTFADVPESHTFYRYIETAYSHGIISGYTCGGAPSAACLNFLPGNNATRGQISKIVYIAVTQP